MCAYPSRRIGRRGASLPEPQLLMLLVAVAISSMAALIWGMDREDDTFAARHNLLKLRRLVAQYRDDHRGQPPSDLCDLVCSSNGQGMCSGRAEVSSEFPIRPYLSSLPENTVSSGVLKSRQSVKRIAHGPPRARDVTPRNLGGWLYHPQTGGVWVDHEELFRM